MKATFQILLTGACVCLAACEPRERAEWSPDGTRAAVLAEQRLYFSDGEGGLSEAVADEDDGPGRFLVDAFDWLPDSSGLVVHRVRLTPKWEDLAPLLAPAESDRVEALAARVPELLRAAVAIHGDSDRADQLLGKMAPGESLAMSNALRLALARDAGAVRAALSDASGVLASIDGDRESLGFLLHEIAVLRPDQGKPSEVIWRGLRGVPSLRVSPKHEVVAAAFETEAENQHDLHVLSFESGAPLLVASKTSRAFDWMPDGGSLVYLSSITEGNGGLVEIERRRVLDESGRVGEALPGAEGDGELAYAIVAFAPRLAVLPDGSILFASHPAPLPAAAEDLGENPRLYRLPADGGAPVAVPTEEGALPMDLGYFVPSPDGRRVAVVESGTDAVAVVDLESGKSELVSRPHPGWKSRVLPSWRNAEEFTYVTGDEETGRVRWMLWKEGESRDLAKEWPEKITQGWMESRKANP